MLWAISCVDKPDTAAIREKHLAAHRAHLASSKGILVLAGATQNDDGTEAIGSLFVVNVGSRANQNDMIKAIAASGIKPFIDSTYQLADIGAAFRHFESRNHFGKVCLDF